MIVARAAACNRARHSELIALDIERSGARKQALVCIKLQRSCQSQEETGIYVKVPGGYDLVDDSEDEDYVCTDEEDSESESESLVDEEDEA